MKRLIASLLILCLLVSLLPALPLEVQAADVSSSNTFWLWTDFAAESFASGSGSESDPYLIATAEQLAYLAVQVNAGNSYEDQYFALADDIDLSNYLWVPIGAWESTPFKGNFNGNRFTIHKMTIENGSVPGEYCGLFGCFPQGTLSNLKLSWGDIYLEENPTVCYIGGVIGYGIGCTNMEIAVSIDLLNYNSGGNYIYCGGLVGRTTRTTQNSSYSGFINVVCLGGAAVGGIHGAVAYNNLGVLTRNCFTSGEISVSSDYDRNGLPSDTSMYVGGLTGTDAQGIANCYSTMSITASGFNGAVGGLVGSTLQDLRNCYATNLVYHYPVYVSNQSSYAYAGGLVGHWTGGNITNCFSSNEIVSCYRADNMQETYAGKLVGYHREGVVGTVTNSYVSEATILERQVFKDGGNCDSDSYPVSNSAHTTYSAPETDTFTYSETFITDTLGWKSYTKYYTNMYLANEVWVITSVRPFLFLDSAPSLTIRYWDPSNTIFKIDLSYYVKGSQYSVTSPELLGGAPNKEVVTGTIQSDTVLDVYYTHQHIPGPEATCVAAQTCTLCGLVLAEALPHDYAATDVIPPKCAENGHTVFVCENCSHVTMGKFVSPLGHTLDTSNCCTRCGIMFEAPLRDFRVHVLDQENGAPLEGASVQLGSSAVVTDGNGIASFQLASEESMILSVMAEGYPQHEVSDFLPGDLPDTYVFITSSDTGIYDARCNNKDVLQSSAQINALSPTLEAKILVQGRSKATISHYELIQDNSVIATSFDGAFTVKNLNFRQGKPVYVQMHTTGPEGSNVFSQLLNIKVVGFTLDASTDWSKLLPFSAGVNLSFPGGTPILEGLNFKLPAHALGKNGYGKFYIGNEKIMFFLGDKSDFNEKDEDLESKTKAQILRQMRDDWIKQNNPKAWPEGKKENEVEASFGLVFEFSDQKITSVYGQINVAYNLSYTNGKTFLVFGFIPLYAQISAGFGGQLQVTELGYDIQNAQFEIPDVQLSLNGQLTLQTGFGCSAISAGVYGTAGATLILGVKDLEEYLSYRLYGEVGLYARMKLLFWKAMEYRIPLIQGEFSGGAGSYARRAMYSMGAYETVSRDYLKNRSTWLPYGTRSGSAPESLTMQTSSYTAIEPRLVTCGDTVMMVFVDDDGSQGMNYQHLYYSLYRKGTGLWSEPKQVDNNNLCDLEFDVCTDGQKIWIVYNQMDAVTADNQDNYEELLSTVEINTAVYDPTSDRFTFDTLTHDSTFDTLPQIAATKDGIEVAWVSNATNDPFCQNANNRIVSASHDGNRWSSNVALTQSGATVVSMDLGMLNDTAYVATLVDMDCELSTIEDRQLVLTHMNGTVTNITTQKNANESVQFGVLNDQQCLLWYQEGNLYRICGPTDVPTPLFDEAVEGLSADYRLITLDYNQQAIVYATPQRWTDENGIEQSGSNLQAIFCMSGNWCDPIPLTQPEADRYVDAYDIQVVDGKLLLPYISTEATVSSNIERVADFRCVYTEVPRDLVVGEVLTLPSTLLNHATMEIKVPFNNHSMFPVSEVTYRVDDAQGNPVAEGTANAPAESGQEGWVTILLPPSALTSGSSYQVTLLPQGWSDENLDNNTANLNIWYGDLSVAAEQILLNSQQVQYAVTNEGNAAASGLLEILLLEENGANTLMHSFNIDALEPGEAIHGMFEVDEALCSANRTILARVTATTEDLYDFNNEASLTLTALVREEITEVPEDQMAVLSPQLSTQYVVYDQRSGGSITIDIIKNGWSFNSIAGCTAEGYSYANNTLVLNEQWLQSLDTGYKNLILGFQHDDDFTKLYVILEIINTEPTQAQITAADQVIPYSGHAPLLGTDILYSTDSLGSVTASYSLYDDGPWTPGLPTEMGTYRIRLQVAEDTDNNLTEGTCYFTLEISKGTRAISLPKVTMSESGAYRFEGALPTVGIGDGVITYGYSTENDPSTVTQWSSTGLVPEPDSSANYYLFARITGGESYQDAYSLGLPLSIHIHTYEVTVTEPTCELAGYTTHRCTGCQDQYIDTPVPPMGHSFTNYVSDNNAACTQDGTQTAICDRCDVTDTQALPDSATGHHYDSGVALKDATCTEDGLLVYTCSCGDQYTSILPAFGHRYDTAVTPPRCEEPGFSTHTCSVCGDQYTDGQLPANGHSYTGTVTAPTCMEGGYTTNVCDICGKTEILEGAGALGHAFTSFVSDGNATCTEDGTKTAQCDRCGRAHTVTDPGSALGHCYDGGLIIQFPGCLTEGIMTYRCELCGDAYDEVLAAVGHQYDTSFMVPPACEETGYTVYSCTGCGDTFAEHDTPATGHLYDQGWCLYCGALEPGYARYTCSIQSFGDPEEPIYLELIPVGSSQAAYSYRLVDNTGEHHLNGIIPGDYTLAIHKKNHVSRYFTVSIQAGENHEDQPWKICLLGDVSGDGRVNVGDVAQLYSHIRKTNLITDEYALACADVTGDGRLNVGDTATLYSHVKNTKKLY